MSRPAPPPPPQQKPRRFDLVVFGATGYTGRLTVEQVLQHTPSTLRWAIAGRQPQRLELLRSEYNRLYPDRVPVEIFVADLKEDAVERLAASTRCLISTVGPFIKYGTAVLEACAVYGTHYVDCTGEFPWVHEMIKRCHKTAQKRGAIIIPMCGFESAPADVGTHLLVKTIRDELGCATADVRMAVHDMKGTWSGGSIETAMAMVEQATIQEMVAAAAFGALSPVQPVPEQPFQWPVREDDDLGTLTSWIGEVSDRAIVMRSWGLYGGGELYGPNFTWREYMRTSNMLLAVWWVFAVMVVTVAPIITPLRWLLRRLVTAPGDGPSAEKRREYFVEWAGIAEADDDDAETPRKALVFMQTPIGIDAYTLTGIFMVQTAMAILFDKNTLARKLGGGVLTPATVVTDDYVQALQRAGLNIEVRLLDPETEDAK